MEYKEIQLIDKNNVPLMPITSTSQIYTIEGELLQDELTNHETRIEDLEQGGITPATLEWQTLESNNKIKYLKIGSLCFIRINGIQPQMTRWSNNYIGTLPEGYRPFENAALIPLADSGYTYATYGFFMVILPNGTMQIGARDSVPSEAIYGYGVFVCDTNG